MKLGRYRFAEPVSVKITKARVVIVVLSAALVAACGAIANNSQTAEFRAQDAIQQHYNQVQPASDFAATGKSRIRQNLGELELAQENGVQTTSFECGSMGGCDPTHPPIKSCPSIGAPIPTTDQITNPDQPLRDVSQPLNDGGGNVVVGQMDPNGVYSGPSSGTYVLCIGAGGAVIPSYWEGDVQVEFAPAQWVQGKGVVDTGPPSFQFTR